MRLPVDSAGASTSVPVVPAAASEWAISALQAAALLHSPRLEPARTAEQIAAAAAAAAAREEDALRRARALVLATAVEVAAAGGRAEAEAILGMPLCPDGRGWLDGLGPGPGPAAGPRWL